jgi:hypothetical protein
MNADLTGCDGNPRLKGSRTAGEAANLELHAGAMAPFNRGTTTIYLRVLGMRNGRLIRNPCGESTDKMTAQGGVRPINAGLGDLIEFNSRQLGGFEPSEADFCPFTRIGCFSNSEDLG